MQNRLDSSPYLKLALEKLYPRLNPAQREAVSASSGPLLVLAGAGSGKTTVLVHRINHLICYGDLFESENALPLSKKDAEALKEALNKNAADFHDFLKTLAKNPVSPERVLCITFTNKAAGEFKARLTGLVGEDAKKIWAGTFHAVCARLLRKHIGLLGFSNAFTIYDSDDTKKLLTQIMKDLRVDDKLLPVKAAAAAISRNKENRVLPEEMEENPRDVRTSLIKEIYADYQKRLKAASALDFDDIILYTLILFGKYPDVLDHYRRKFEYILVDEYQDTNPSQNDLVLALGQRSRNVCVVGDDDQSIYSFRGATVHNILNFDSAFPDAKTIRLEQNYRSTGTILDAANAVIANNKGRKGKNLWTAGTKGDKIVARQLYSQAEEADFICGEIARLHAFQTPLKDIAVLYRVNAVANALETAFVKNRLPYRVFGGIRFYDRKEVKDIIAYLSVLLNPADDVRLRRIINVPKRAIGETTVASLTEAAAENGVSLLEAAGNARQYAAKYPALNRALSKLESFYALIADLSAFASQNSVSALIDEVIARTGYTEKLETDHSEKIEIVKEFVSSGVVYENSAENPTLSGFLEDIALISDTDSYDEANETVSLMTVHSAKGLEFPVVFIAGFEEGVFPSYMSVAEGNTEEERRLFYVAITRAKEKLYLTHAQVRTLYGLTAAARPSTFLEEIPETLLLSQKTGAYERGGDARLGKNEVRLTKTGGNFSEKSRDFGSKSSFHPKESARKTDVFKPGDSVEHKFFGKGVVLSYEAMGNDALIGVEFENGQVKKLMASFAKLLKI